MALSALSPAPDERCRVLATDGQVLFYQPSHLLRLYQDNPKYLNRLYLHTIFHCVFRHLWLKGRREPQLWSLACDIAVENVIDSLNRTSVKRPLTYVRQNAYQQITAEKTVVAAAPVYRWLTRQTPGVLRQLEREFVTDDHRLCRLNLHIKKGTVYGFLGPNGAGKSTTMKMFLGLTRPTAGGFLINGLQYPKDRMTILKNVGSLIEEPAFYGNLSGR